MAKAKITPRNIKKFIVGWYRWLIFKLMKNKYLKIDELPLLAVHKQEQYKYRLMVMRPECLNSGHCVICGCKTPQLQMTDEACEGNCYPYMMEKQDWENYKTENHVIL